MCVCVSVCVCVCVCVCAVSVRHRGIIRACELRAQGKLNVPLIRHKQSTLCEALFKTAHAGDLKYVRMLLEERGLNVNSTDRVSTCVRVCQCVCV